MKRPLPNLLAGGLQLGLRNWPCVVWTYAVNLLFGLLAGVPFSTGLASTLDHSLAAQRIGGTLDAGYLWELLIHLRGTSYFWELLAHLREFFVHFRDTSFVAMAMRTAGWLNALQLLVLFVFFAGSVFVYVSAEPPRLSVLLRGGVAYFWRFVRAAIVAGCISALVLWVLLAVQAAVMARAGNVYVERRMFVYWAISMAVVLLVALFLRLWWDLVEVYIVRNAMDGERAVRRALLPALRLLFRYFFRTFGSFLVAGLAGVSALGLCLALWRVLPAHQVWLAFLLAQVGLFLLLAGRFWQRGLEATLVMAADPPRIIREEVDTDEVDTEEMAPMMEEVSPRAAKAGVLPGVSEPTLRDLVQKLRTEPWGNPDISPGPLPPEMAQPLEGKGPPLLDRHEDKFPLGGVSPGQEAVPAQPVEPQHFDDLEKTPHSEKKPLP